MTKFKCNHCNRIFDSTPHHNCKPGFRKRKHSFTTIKQKEMNNHNTLFGQEFASYEAAENIHNMNIEFHAFGYWNQIGEEWKLGQNALTLEAIKAPLLQQYLKFSNL